MSKTIKIAVDGFSSCGKSTLAKQLASHFGFVYVDSGAMYRAVTLFSLRNNLFDNGVLNIDKLVVLLPEIDITFTNDSNKGLETWLNGENVEDEIRQLEVSSKVSLVSAIPEVRKRMVELQREMSLNKSVVMDGRDIGTVVFRDADVKLFVTASPEIRAQRRYMELSEKGVVVDYNEILNNICERDNLDQSRNDSPLRQAEDAVLIDNSELNREQQLELAIKIISDKINENRN
ncbi:MAG: (d)CMP kinase [Bacteroidales bacterium]|jgi:cytidylate kinase|nr:(d)CMP kinase [Bacteroidales bacterium]